MKSAIRKIDRAIKSLYNLDSRLRAEDFLLPRPLAPLAESDAQFRGALFVCEETADDLAVGIYLNESVRDALARVAWSDTRRWSPEQVSAFSVASEEVSHFHYLVHHASAGRPVSQFELELQGDIDKFLLSYFVGNRTPAERAQAFEGLYDRIFVSFRLHAGMSPEQVGRYEDANRFARRFIVKWGVHLKTGTLPELALRILRKYYRLGAAEKLSFISSD